MSFCEAPVWKLVVAFIHVLFVAHGSNLDIARAPAPLYRDPIFDGAADPTVVYDQVRGAWVIFYTQRRASDLSLLNKTWCFGTDIGVAMSKDMGVTWAYQGVAKGLHFEPGTNTFWAPDVLKLRDPKSMPGGLGAEYHMHVTYIKGAAAEQSFPLTNGRYQRKKRLTGWGEGVQRVAHYSTSDLLGTWVFQGLVPALDKVLDPDVVRLPDGLFKMWFKDLRTRGQTGAAVSSDLATWRRLAALETATSQDLSSASALVYEAHKIVPPHEAPNVFEWRGFHWLLVDPLEKPGILVLRSADGSPPWSLQKEPVLHWGGIRPLDSADGNHVDVVVDADRAFLFYFVHPGRPCQQKASLQFRQSVLQVAELEFEKEGRSGGGAGLKCKRDRYAKWGKERSKRGTEGNEKKQKQKTRVPL
mmetsp:Transcript_32273/g.54403  ORF Transcript_32273/g.54403 Transcript_32273/m.54403 type:complete len:415 (-) Transcript_32273:316-1560(-)